MSTELFLDQTFEYIDSFQALKLIVLKILHVARELIATIESGKKIFICENGDSSVDASTLRWNL